MSTPSELPAQIAGRYRPLRELGRGGMGVVYVAEHVHTGEQVALKVLLGESGASADRVERFKREARASARIKSEHVVRVTDADVAPELGGKPFLVMELLEGMDLGALCEDTARPSAEVIDWLRQAARGLDKAHAIGLVHRDLKPENLFLARREDGRPILKILDFGLVKSSEDAGGNTRTGEILGTPRYMSPEQARGESDRIGPATDRWAIGVVAYRLLTGDDYFTADALAPLIAQICYEPMRAPSERGQGFGPAFDAWMLRSCHRDAAQRFATVGEQVEALAEALGAPALPVVAQPPPVSSGAVGGQTTFEGAPTLEASESIVRGIRSSPAPRRFSTAAVAIAVVVVVGGGVAVARSSLWHRQVLVADVPQSPSAPPPAPQPAASEVAIQPSGMDPSVSPAIATASASGSARGAPPPPSKDRARPVATPITKAAPPRGTVDPLVDQK